jgi:hypothetical protein
MFLLILWRGRGCGLAAVKMSQGKFLTVNDKMHDLSEGKK